MAKFGPRRRAAIDRFAEKVALTDSGCIQWLASTDGTGYGKFMGEPGRNGRLSPAHRWFYEYVVGPVPAHLHLDHLCRNRLCVNPEHLEPVTQRVNVLRGVGASAKNIAKTHCPSGHPYSGDNLYRSPSGGRGCRACSREHDRKRRPRKTRKAA